MLPSNQATHSHAMIGWRLVNGLAAAVVALGSLLTFSVAQAAPTTPFQNKHCIIELAAAKPGEQMNQPTAPPRCFPTLQQAVNAASGGAVKLPSATNPEAVTTEMLQPETTYVAGYRVIGLDYQNSIFRGRTLTWYTRTGRSCSPSSYFYARSMPSGWNDVVSSSRVSNNCSRVTRYEHVNFGGRTLTTRGNVSFLGWFNDRTSSIVWRY